MSENRTWVGNLRGTRVAFLFAEIVEKEGQSVLILKIGGDSGALTFTGPTPDSSRNGMSRLTAENDPSFYIDLQVTSPSTSDTQIVGRWEMSDRSAGILDLTKSNGVAQQAFDPSTLFVTNKSVSLPRLTLFRDEVKEIVSTMKHLLQTDYDVWVKAGVEGKEEVTALDKTFWQKPNLPKQATQLTLTLSEPPSPVARVLTVSLGPDNSFYSASGMDEVWVAGAMHKLGDVFESKRRWWRTIYEKHGLDFNALAVIVALIAAPSLQLIPRIIFFIITFFLMIGFFFLHKFTTRMSIHLKQDYKASPLIELPRLLTSLAGSMLVAMTAWLASQLTDSRLADWLGWLSLLLKDGG
ncbi:hypothetical protein [Agrobacterium rosae]|uniref:hypothetical protein n=1 Tax=Agrobacterium rosae TaxID=1972867 RepID=UPI000CD93C08|nr:hypothetical protein [Agrobacterium rosae]POO58024.1 hypothetical protein CTT39_05185 [Agrobacterium rosae]